MDFVHSEVPETNTGRPQHRRLESNQWTPRSERGAATNNCYSGVSLLSQKHSVRESHPICELQRLAPRLRTGESVLRESNPPTRIGSPTPLPIGQGHTHLRSSGGWTRTITRLLNREPPYHWATPEFASAQRELNPHFRHGKAAGYRYIMGAKLHHNQIVKDRSGLSLLKAPSRN
jgi:hypothetical protein